MSDELNRRVQRLENILLNQLAGVSEDADLEDETANSEQHENLFGFGGKKQRAYYADFEDADGNVWNLVVEAPNEAAALKEAKRLVREDGGSLKGGTWDVVLAENLTHLVIERKEKQ
jgi:hypothetical protein